MVRSVAIEMPCLMSNMSDIDDDDGDVRKLLSLSLSSTSTSTSTSPTANVRQRTMCSTPLRAENRSHENGSVPTAQNLHTDEWDAASPFDQLHREIQLELWKISRLRVQRKTYSQRINMLKQWENLERNTDEWERKCSLQRDVIKLRKKVLKISSSIPNAISSVQIQDRTELENLIKNVKVELDSITDIKTLIGEYNARAHQLSCSPMPLSVQDDINSLHRTWTETQQKISRQLTTLEQAWSTWSDFDKHMSELKTVLREEHKALDVLDQALKTTEDEDGHHVDMASAVQCIVKYLPEKHRDGLLKVNKNSAVDRIDGVSNLLRNTLNAEGSFSDSGISDSGSEHDIFDREKRLALLRKLARHLEAILAPGSEALLNIMKKIDEAEEEIRELQQTYRTIKTDYLEKSERCSQQQQQQQQVGRGETASSNFRKDSGRRKTCPDDPGSDPSEGRSIFWRVLRAALPFHVVVVVLLCVAYLLEPNCCDTINNLNMSLLPQLRFFNGPPPT